MPIKETQFCGGCGRKSDGSYDIFCKSCAKERRFFSTFDKVFFTMAILFIIFIKLVGASGMEGLSSEAIKEFKNGYQVEADRKRELKIKLKSTWYDYEKEIQVILLAEKEFKRKPNEERLKLLFKWKKYTEEDYKKATKEIDCLGQKWKYIDKNKKILDKCVDKKVENKKDLTRASDDLLRKVAKEKGINEKHFLALNKNENGAMIVDLQAQSPLKNMYPASKIKQIKNWWEERKSKGEFPKDWDCSKEQGVGLFQINLWVHKGITYNNATDPEFNADWTADRLLAKGYDKDKLKAIQAHNGFKMCVDKDIKDKVCINGYSYRYAYNVLNKAKSL